MKRILFGIGLALFALNSIAQDIYKVEALSSNDLNGTARYVGMGGAMNALGADISTMNTNPAGIGLYRRNDAAFTLSLTNQPNAESFMDIEKSRVSFDQAGIVLKTDLSGNSLKYMNFGINYQKVKNFKNYIGVFQVPTYGLSQTRLMQNIAFQSSGFIEMEDAKGNPSDLLPPYTYLGYKTQMLIPQTDGSGKTYYVGTSADEYNYKRAQWGGIQAYDFNLAFNFDDQIYVGATVGYHDVNFHSGMYYEEYELQSGSPVHNYINTNEESLKGFGYNFKAGVILRPILESPFRIGFAISTPTWYELTYNAFTSQDSPFKNPATGENHTYKTCTVDNHDYKIQTPWKFSLSMATTFGKKLALDAEFEYEDFSTSSVSYTNYNDYNPFNNTYGSQKDQGMRTEIKNNMLGVMTARVGAEYNLNSNWALRAGYNYVSTPFKKDAYLNQLADGPSYFYQVNTDYVNLGDINRFTVGLGYHNKNFYMDLAYQFQKQQGEITPFQTQDNDAAMLAAYPSLNLSGTVNSMLPEKVDLNRHNFMLTLGYKF